MTHSTNEIARAIERAQGLDPTSLVLAVSGPHVLVADCNAGVRPFLRRGAMRFDVEDRLNTADTTAAPSMRRAELPIGGTR